MLSGYLDTDHYDRVQCLLPGFYTTINVAVAFPANVIVIHCPFCPELFPNQPGLPAWSPSQGRRINCNPGIMQEDSSYELPPGPGEGEGEAGGRAL